MGTKAKLMDEKNILRVTSEGLAYLDEQGHEQFIDFAACYQRYVDKWNDPDHLKRFKAANPTRSDEELEASAKSMTTIKEIVGRDFTGPMIAFYTEPLTDFYFSNRDEYDKVVFLVRKAGWRLRDWA